HAGHVQDHVGAAALGHRQALRGDVGDGDVAGAGVAGDGGGHLSDRAGAGDQHALPPHLELPPRVHGVAARRGHGPEVGADPALCPIGPAPVISTSSPTTSYFSAVCTALPSGSNTAPRSGLISSSPPSCSCTHTFWCGSVTYSAKAPSRWTPMERVRMHIWRRPARQLRHTPHTTWPSPEMRSPTRTSPTSSPASTTSP